MTDHTGLTLEGAHRDLSVSRDAVRWSPVAPERLPTLTDADRAEIIRSRRRAINRASARRRIAANLATSHARKDPYGP